MWFSEWANQTTCLIFKPMTCLLAYTLKSIRAKVNSSLMNLPWKKLKWLTFTNDFEVKMCEFAEFLFGRRPVLGKSFQMAGRKKSRHFWLLYKKQKETHSFSDNTTCIGNMDKVLMSFDAPANRTVDLKGSNTVNIVTNRIWKKKKNFTVVLACMANGAKVQPMVMLKRNNMPKEKLTPNVYVSMNNKGMNEQEMWIQFGAGKVDARV